MIVVPSLFVEDPVLAWLVVLVAGTTAISGGAWLFARFAKVDAAARHLVLSATLICCLAAPVLAGVCGALGLRLWRIPAAPSAFENALQVDRPTDAAEPRSTASATNEDRDEGRLSNPDRVPATASASSTSDPTPPSTNPLPSQAITANPSIDHPKNFSSTPPFPTTQSAPSPRRVGTRILTVWGSLAALLLARLLVRCRRLHLLRTRATPVAADRPRRLLADAAQQAGLTESPDLLVSSRAAVPLAAGLGRPAVILPPAALEQLEDDQLRDIFLHEAAHIRRRDPLVALIQAFASAVYWPVLTLHALNRSLQQAREELCDNVVLSRQSACHYGETLLRVAQLSLGRTTVPAVGILSGAGELERRVRTLLDPGRSLRTMPTTLQRSLAAIAVLAASLAAASFGFEKPPEPPQQPPQTNPEKTAPSPPAVAKETAKDAPPAAPPATPVPRPLTDDDLKTDPDDPKFTGHFRGKVLGPDGQPFAGARVYAIPKKQADRGPGEVRTVTDDRGYFAFDAPDLTFQSNLDGGLCRWESYIVVAADGYGPDWYHTWGHDTGTFREYWTPVKGAILKFQLAKDDVPIQGKFVDQQGAPVAGARVRYSRVMIPRDRNLDEHLQREAKKSTSAFFLSPGEAYELGTVLGLFDPEILPGFEMETRTDAGGKFTLRGLGRDRLADLTVTAPGLLEATVRVMTRAAPDVPTILDFNGKPTSVIYGQNFSAPLNPALTLTGIVRDQETGQPIPGMLVTHRNDPRNRSDRSNAPVTDAEGRFSLSGLDPKVLTYKPEFRTITAYPPPGSRYLLGDARIEEGQEIAIECQRGIPYRLRVVDEQEVPVEAEVAAKSVSPNPSVEALRKTYLSNLNYSLVGRGARQPDGTYIGSLIPGPGALLIDAPPGYREAWVDVQTFFDPDGKRRPDLDYTAPYGTNDLIATESGHEKQSRYDAIVLVNTMPGSGPLELTATLVRDVPRQVQLVDEQGRPVVGARVEIPGEGSPPPLRGSTYPLKRLNPHRWRARTFLKEDRKLIGFLATNGEGEIPETVALRPWGSVKGRFVNGAGEPVKNVQGFSVVNVDPRGAPATQLTVNPEGEFRIDRLVPGQTYRLGSVFLKGSGGRPMEVVDSPEIVVAPTEEKVVGDQRLR